MSSCQVCAYVASQLGPNTPCFVHVGRDYFATAPDADFGLVTPFTVREYGRLLVLRSRFREQRWLDRAS